MNSDAKLFDKLLNKVAAQYRDELIHIGRCSDEERYEGEEKICDSRFLSLARGRTREIGKQLNELGGIVSCSKFIVKSGKRFVALLGAS
jgi:hypothetical protein